MGRDKNGISWLSHPWRGEFSPTAVQVALTEVRSPLMGLRRLLDPCIHLSVSELSAYPVAVLLCFISAILVGFQNSKF